MILISDDYGLVGDNSTDNATAIGNWISAANTAIGGGDRVRMVLTPGRYKTSGSHAFPGEADIEFQAATLIRTGSDVSTPCFIHGTNAAPTDGRLTGIAVDSIASGNLFYDPNSVGVRLINKIGAVHDIKFVRGFAKGVQCRAHDHAFAYNEVTIGQIFVCPVGVELNCSSANTAFPSENKFNGGNVQSSSSLANFGSCWGMVFSRDYETGGYSGHSGNFWYKPCFQLGTPGLAWTASTALTAGRRYYSPRIGGEWLCKTGGISGTVEPTLLPPVVDKTDISLAAGSTVATMASTTGLAAGMHLRGSNPLDAFPLDTYVVSVDSGTQITLSRAASRSSNNYHGIFVAPTTDNAATLIYLGPYRRAPVWMRECGVANGVLDARWESGAGEAVIVSGPHLYPEKDDSVHGAFTGTFHSRNQAAIKVCNFPVWASRNYLAGEAVRPTVLGNEYWECIVAGAAGGSEPIPSTTVPGSTFTDGAVTWLIRRIPDTDSRGDWGEYTGAAGGLTANFWNISVGRPFDPVTSTAKLDNLHLRAVGSAAGWLVRGAVKCTTGAVMTASFAANELALSREALLLKVSGVSIGAILKTDELKCFSFKKSFAPFAYGLARAWMIPLDVAYRKLTTQSASQAYHRRIQSCCVVGGGLFYNEPNDGPVREFTALVNDEVKNVFFGIARGTSTAPIALTGIEIAAKPHRARLFPQSGTVHLFTLHGNDNGPRMSLGVPTSGFFLAAGEFIQNASFTAGASPKGWRVKTVGALAPSWAASTGYVKGELIAAGGNIYAANGAFTSGTTPSGTGSNILDSTATAIASGDVATWDYVAPVAVLTADEDTNALFQAGSTGAAPTPNCTNGLTQVWTMNNNVTVGAPTNPPQIGQALTLVFVQDATGSRTIAWNVAYRNAPAWSAGVANARASAEFKYDGVGWQFTGGSTAFA